MISGFAVKAFLFALLAYGYKLFLYNPEEAQIHLEGTVEPNFEKVKEAFRSNLKDNWERGGGAFVAYYKGQKVVDIWGGYSDKESGRLWKNDTMSIAFSSTKAIAALCLGKLVDEGYLLYDDLVTKHWPEFGKNGKENITIQWIMNHQAGLAFTKNPIDFQTAINHRAMSELFENQKPNWPPGTDTGYHAITYGWLVDQLIRRTDPKKRSIGLYFKEELAEKYGIDFHIGLPSALSHRVARLKSPSKLDVLEEFIHAPENINLLRFIQQTVTNGIMVRVMQINVPWIHFAGDITLNNPDYYSIEQAGVLGIGVARDVARLFELFRKGEIISSAGVQNMISDYVTQTDMVTGATVPRGKGLMMHNFQRNGKTYKLYGHAGYGGQNVKIDFDNELTVAYLSNHLKVGLGDTARTYIRLMEALFDTIEALKK